MPIVLIVILNLNKKEDLKKCLSSVFCLDFPSFEVIVVDNASTDGSVEMVCKEFREVHLLESKTNLGAVGGRNAGIAFAKEKLTDDFQYVLFLDNDVEIETSFLGHLVEVLTENKEIGLVGGKAYTEKPSTILMSTGIYFNRWTGYLGDRGSGEEDQGQYDRSCYVDACGGFGVLIKKELLEKLNGFDLQFNPYGWGEIDLALRAKQLGFLSYYNPKAIIYHKGCKIGRGVVEEYEKYKTRNYFFLIKRHTNPLQYLSCIICLCFRGIWRVCIGICRGEFKLIASQLRAAFEGIILK